jgi:hypothetical protein
MKLLKEKLINSTNKSLHKLFKKQILRINKGIKKASKKGFSGKTFLYDLKVERQIQLYYIRKHFNVSISISRCEMTIKWRYNAVKNVI